MDNREIIDYDILKAETVEELATLTNKAIRDGWRPVGGAFMGTPFFRENERVTDNPLEIVGGHTINTFCQTVVMYRNNRTWEATFYQEGEMRGQNE
jgi:hypothetical protein